LTVFAKEKLSATEFILGFDSDGYPLTEFECSDMNKVSTMFAVNGRVWVGSYQHRFETGDIVTIQGADQAHFNFSMPITVTNDNVFYVDMPGLAPETATGNLQVFGKDLGFFEFDGVMMPQGQSFEVSAEDVDKLFFTAIGPNDEKNIYLRGFDGAKWSVPKKGVADIRVNANRPTVQFSRSVTPADQLHSFADSLNVTDADMSTIKDFLFFNTSPAGRNGDLIFKGQVMPRKTWFNVAADELDQLEFITPRQGFEQLIRVRAYDGLHWSGAGTHTIESTPPIVRPELEPTVTVLTEEQRVTVDIGDFFVKTDPGNPHTRVQIFEPSTNPESGEFLFGNIPLDGGQIHEFSTAAFDSAISFRTGDYWSRHIDTVYQRNFNGSDWSKWNKVEIRTEPEIEDVLTSGATWSGLLPVNFEGKLSISYSFMQFFPEYNTGEAVDAPANGRPFQIFDDTQRANTRLALTHLEEFINVDFVEVPDSGNNVFGGMGGIMRFGEYGIPFPDSVASAFAFYPGFGDAPGDVWINRKNMHDGFATPMNVDTDGFMILLHEIGHAMGLKHPHEGTPRLSPMVDTNDYTVMSYNSADNFVPATFQPYDVTELQDLYGANTDFNADDTVYSIGGYFGRQAFVETIWDGGGIDVLSAEGSVRPAVIDLRTGARSSVGAVPDNLSIAYGVDIENAIGSSGGDQITGNHLDNHLAGGDGNDFLFGMQGVDTMVGGAGNDTFAWGVGDGDDIIEEQ